MRLILHFLKKEFAQLRRDRKMLPIVFIAPVLQLFFLGYAANLDVDMIPMVTVDLDSSTRSRQLIEAFVQSGYFDELVRLRDPEKIDGYIDNGDAVVALVIPKNFQKDLGSGKTAPLQFITDGADSNTSTIALNYAGIIVSRFSAALRLELTGGPEAGSIPLEVEPRVWYNPELKSRNASPRGIVFMKK